MNDKLVDTRNISSGKHFEKARNEGDENLRLMFESIAEGVIVTDFQGIITRANNAAAQLHGFDNSYDLIGMSALSLLPVKTGLEFEGSLEKHSGMGAVGFWSAHVSVETISGFLLS